MRSWTPGNFSQPLATILGGVGSIAAVLSLITAVQAAAPARVSAADVGTLVSECIRSHATSGTQRIKCVSESWEASLHGSGMTRAQIRAYVEGCEDAHVLHPKDLETCVATKWKESLAAAAASPAGAAQAPAPIVPVAPVAAVRTPPPLRIDSTPRPLALELKNAATGEEGLGVRGSVSIRASAEGFKAFAGTLTIPSEATTLTIALCPAAEKAAVAGDHWETTTVKPPLELDLAGKTSPRVSCAGPGCEHELVAKLDSDLAAIVDAMCKAWDPDAVRVKGTPTTPGLEATPRCEGAKLNPECWLDVERGRCRVTARRHLVHAAAPKKAESACPARGVLKLDVS